MNANITRSPLGAGNPRWLAFAVPLLLFLFTFLFLYLFRPLEMSDNSLWSIDAARRASLSNPTFYPPHLLHTSVIALLHSALSNISSCDVVCAGMLQSMFWAAIAIASTYLIARVILNTVIGAIGVALTVLVAHGFWVYATQLEVYVPLVGCVTGATALLFTNQSGDLSNAKAALVSALWALATMYHLAAILFFIPLCAFFYSTQGPGGWRQLAAVSGLAGSAVLLMLIIAYSWAFRSDSWSLAGFVSWVLEITNRPLATYGTLSNWQPIELVSAGWSQIKTITLLPDYLAIDQLPPLDQLPLAIIGAIVVVTVLLWNSIQIIRRAPAVIARVYFLLLFGTNFIFFSWWEPGTHKFYIPSSIALIMLMALTVRDVYINVRGKLIRGAIGGAVAAIIAVMFVFNLDSVLELRRSQGPFYAEAEVFNRLAPQDCKIYAVGTHVAALKVYFERRSSVFIGEAEQNFYRFATGATGFDQSIFRDEECAFIPLGYLSEQRYNRRVSGFVNTAGWPDYVAYVLDVRVSPGNGGITYNPFELKAEGDGPPNVLIDRRRRVHGRSLDLLTESIKAEVDRALQQFEGDYPTEEWGYDILAVPRTNVEIGRDRDLIFGYSWGDMARRPGRFVESGDH